MPGAVNNPRSLRARPELELEFDQESNVWLCSSPIENATFRLGQLENTVLQHAQTWTSAEQIVVSLVGKHASPADESAIRKCIERLLSLELLVCRLANKPNASPKVTFLSKQLGTLKLFNSFLCFQIRGFDPSSTIQAFSNSSGLVFSRTAVVFWCLFACLTASLVSLELPALMRELGSLAWISETHCGILMMVIFIVTTALHELGHAFACSRFKLKCTDIGLLIMFGAPCVYCDVSATSKLPNRIHRAAVAAAGMYVEMIIASIAAWFWLTTSDNTLHLLSLQTMIICSVGTLLVNLNPLMRFDGYFILSDLTNHANLRQHADQCVLDLFDRLFSSSSSAGQANIGQTIFWSVFAIACRVYRFVLFVAICTLAIQVTRSWQLAWMGWGFSLLLFSSWWLPSLSRTWNKTRANRPFVTVSLAVSFLLLVLFSIPLPRWRSGRGWLEPAEATGVFAPADAELVSAHIIDQKIVDSGHVLFELDSPETRETLARTQLQVQHAKLQLQFDEHQKARGNKTLAVNGQSKAKIEKLIKLEEKLKAELAQLQVRSPNRGKLYYANHQISTLAEPFERKHTENTIQLVAFNHKKNYGSRVRKGQLLGVVYAGDFQAIVVIDDKEINEFPFGTRVTLYCQNSQSLVMGKLSHLIREDQFESLWPESVRSLKSETPQENQRLFAIVSLTSQQASSFVGSQVEATFHLQPRCLAAQIYDWLTRPLPPQSNR